MTALYTESFGNFFVEQLLELKETEYLAVRAAITNLNRFPRLGVARPSGELSFDFPYELRKLSIPSVNLQLFYSCDDAKHLILCWYLWDTRRDPSAMFTGFYFD